MTATARMFVFTEEDLQQKRPSSGTGQWEDLEVPGDYEVFIDNIEDYIKKDGNEVTSYKVTIRIEVESGSLFISDWIPFSKAGRWKMRDYLIAVGMPPEPNVPLKFDPEELTGLSLGATIDFPRNQNGEPTSKYREIMAIFPLVEPPDVGGSPTTPLEEPEVL